MFPVTKSHNNCWFVFITSSRERVARFHSVTVKLYPLGQEERGHLFLRGVSHARRWLTSRTGPCHRTGLRMGHDSQSGDDYIVHPGILFQVCHSVLQNSDPFILFFIEKPQSLKVIITKSHSINLLKELNGLIAKL